MAQKNDCLRKRMTTSAFALCASGLVKLTPVGEGGDGGHVGKGVGAVDVMDDRHAYGVDISKKRK